MSGATPAFAKENRAIVHECSRLGELHTAGVVLATVLSLMLAGSSPSTVY